MSELVNHEKDFPNSRICTLRHVAENNDGDRHLVQASGIYGDAYDRAGGSRIHEQEPQ